MEICKPQIGPIEEGKRIRAIIHYMGLDNNPYFLLLRRKSTRYPRWEFIKEGFNPRDRTIEDTLYRGIREESGILETDFVSRPRSLGGIDAIHYKGEIQTIETYDIRVRNPPPDVVLSLEHTDFNWDNAAEACEKLVASPEPRRNDLFVFLGVLGEMLELAQIRFLYNINK